jgi:hypothetical protein
VSLGLRTAGRRSSSAPPRVSRHPCNRFFHVLRAIRGSHRRPSTRRACRCTLLPWSCYPVVGRDTHWETGTPIDDPDLLPGTKKGLVPNRHKSLLGNEYQRSDSNRHVLNGHWILNPARLPIPPLWLSCKAVTRSLSSKRIGLQEAIRLRRDFFLNRQRHRRSIESDLGPNREPIAARVTDRLSPLPSKNRRREQLIRASRERPGFRPIQGARHRYPCTACRV